MRLTHSSTGPEYLNRKGMVDGEELFYAQENATVVKDAEEYYRFACHTSSVVCDGLVIIKSIRKAYAGGAVTWNLRDRHMHNTLKEILEHFREKRGWNKPKAGMYWIWNIE